MKWLVAFIGISPWVMQVESLMGQEVNDTLPKPRKYGAGVLPAIAYNSDLGFQYGVLTNLYAYSTQHPYPNYANSLYFEASKYTAGSAMLRVFLDSRTLLSPFRSNFDCTYIRDLTNDFFGFNGSETHFNANFEDEDHSDYLSRVFYKYDSEMFRLMGNVKGFWSGIKWFWVAGFSLLHYRIAPVDIDRLNKRHPRNPLPEVEGLYEKYVRWGLITADEKNGGFNTQLRVGAGYDSRDFESNPSKGVWSELLLSAMPSWGSSHSSGNLQVTVLHRQYFTLVPNKTIFAYRLQVHSTPLGSVPFYLLSSIPATWLTGAYSEGLGGYTTLRGVRRNRVIGKGFVLANAEIRQRLVSFKMKRQDIYIATNLFSDAGRVIQPYHVKMDFVPEPERNLYFSGQDEQFHFTYGMGLKFVLNENFIVSADYGLVTDSQMGNSGLYINLNYLF
jgi:outer membrane protein assembly factor BamA